MESNNTIQSQLIGIPLAIYCSLEVSFGEEEYNIWKVLMGQCPPPLKAVDILLSFGRTYPVVAQVSGRMLQLSPFQHLQEENHSHSMAEMPMFSDYNDILENNIPRI
jgi:hypothetical protein